MNRALYLGLSVLFLSPVYGGCNRAPADLLRPERRNELFQALDHALDSGNRFESRYFSGGNKVRYNADVTISKGDLRISDLSIFAFDARTGRRLNLNSELKDFIELRSDLIEYAREKHLNGVIIDTYRCVYSTSCNKGKKIHIELKVPQAN